MKTKHLILALVILLMVYVPVPESEEVCKIPSLQVTLQRTGTPCTDSVLWEVRKNGELSFADYSDSCTEGNPEITVTPTRPQTVTCSSWKIPLKQTGPHTARLSWCGASVEFQYGGPCDFPDRATCETEETKGNCWWDDGNNDCKMCEKEGIKECADYPTRVWGVVGGVCPVCMRNPCQVEGPCQIAPSGLLGVSCTKCDTFESKIGKCKDYRVASSCDCDPCKAGKKTGHKCDWGVGPTVEKYIEIELAEKYGDATTGTMELKCGATEVSGEVVSVSGRRVKFRVTKEQLKKLFDAGCWYN